MVPVQGLLLGLCRTWDHRRSLPSRGPAPIGVGCWPGEAQKLWDSLGVG